MRQFDSDTYRGFKTACRRLLKSFGKLENAAAETRVNTVSLCNYSSLNVEQEKAFMPTDVLIDLMGASGEYAPLEYMAGIYGKTLVDKPIGRSGTQSIKLSCAVKEMAEAIAATTDPNDIEAIKKEGAEAMQALADLLASYETGSVVPIHIAGE